MPENEEEVNLDLIAAEHAGARARAKRLVREGLPDGSKVSDRQRDSARYRAALALLWDREKILFETGWSLQKLQAVEKVVHEEDVRVADELDPRSVYSEYKLRQFQAAQELEDLTEIFRQSRQYSALVSAVKARSDILDRVVKMGQELGVIKRVAREVNVNTQIDVRTMSMSELKIYLSREIREMEALIEPGDRQPLAEVVLAKVLSPPKEDVIEADAVEERIPVAKAAPRVRVLRPEKK